jgi:hypothetical protein
MKNIHILPTDKSSRLRIGSDGLNLSRIDFVEAKDKQHIYITSNEKIKKSNYFLSLNDDESYLDITLNNEVDDFNQYADEDWVENCKKIILTTDQDLINDGVQAIPDEFLEWFVKNPNCEEVEINFSLVSGSFKYKIIIPKEEPKQETRKICKCKRAYENPLSEICSLCWNELYPNEKDEIKEEDLLELKQETLEEHYLSIPKPLVDVSRMKLDNHPDKQETLEEAVNRLYKELDYSELDDTSFKLGVKWQAERMYSEEEVFSIIKKAFIEGGKSGHNPMRDFDLEEWIEQFKKK